MQTHQSDWSDSQWEIVEKLLVCQRKRKYDLRQIVHAILYLLTNGVKWHNLPEDYPHRPTDEQNTIYDSKSVFRLIQLYNTFNVNEIQEDWNQKPLLKEYTIIVRLWKE